MSKLDESEKVSQVNNRRLFAMGRLVLLFVLAIALIYWLFGWIKGSFFYVHETEKWLVFPHELHGLSKQEIENSKPFALKRQGFRDLKSA